MGTWLSDIGFNSVCKNITTADIKLTDNLLLYSDRLSAYITKRFHIEPIAFFKMNILKITIFFVVLGLLIDKVVDFINRLLDSFGFGSDKADEDYWKNGYSEFMKVINMGVMVISYILTIAIGIYIFTILSKLIKKGKNCMLLRALLISIEKLLIYLFPMIIIASLINSSAQGLAATSNDICNTSNSKDDFDYGVPEFISQFGTLIFIPLVLFAIIYFLFFNCYTHSFFKNTFKVLQLSTIANLLVISFSVLISILLFGFIYSKYSSVLISYYGLNYNYIVLSILSIIIYLIILKRPKEYESAVSYTKSSLEQFLPAICNLDVNNSGSPTTDKVEYTVNVTRGGKKKKNK